ncbi:NACHT domain-containing protein [Aeromonas bestiarum]|uniref:hypothetical protein n=1 Tax=Aeromonas bestiarum TaxID=105751 RepID=UPI000B0F8F0A|nr:hypothetical protein [Aeromonas bestiarum]
MKAEIIPNWKKHEQDILTISKIIFNADAKADRLHGVNYDAVIKKSNDEIIIIEMTVRNDLTKVREDVIKIYSTKLKFAAEGVIVRGYIVLDSEPTQGMLDIGADHKIQVLSKESFISQAFKYKDYYCLRNQHPFGSAINPSTGRPDTHQYISVNYYNETKNKSFSIDDLAKKIERGEKIVLLGDYGTGKSRCIKETFTFLSERLTSKYVLAINLREHWGASFAEEIITGHLKRLGLSTSIDRAMQLLHSGSIVILLDGFDEVGSQLFVSNQEKRDSLRKEALKGVSDLIRICPSGVLITGRPHFFHGNKEMLECLGLSTRSSNTNILYCESEFNEVQAALYLQSIGINNIPPVWFPKKPLIFQILSQMNQNEIVRVLSSNNGELHFWGQFLDTICQREATIVKNSIDPDVVRLVLSNLAKTTRCGNYNLGRLTIKDVNNAYEKATGNVPDEAGNLMLSRLCTLGRVEPESPDRQFIDTYIVQLLYADSLVDDITNKEFIILDEDWKQPLNKMGSQLLSQWIDLYDLSDDALSFIHRGTTKQNQQVIGELTSSIYNLSSHDIDFGGVSVESIIPILLLGARRVFNVTFRNCIIEEVCFNDCKVDQSSHVTIIDSDISEAKGMASTEKLPEWIKNTNILKAESTSNSSRIKSSNLPASQKLFLSIIQKIFFQRGGGRKENSLYKGAFGQEFDRKKIERILSILLTEGLIEKSKDTGGFIYNPKREYTSRMKLIKDQLALSTDELWLKIKELD